MELVTVTIQIGNSDNKLSQKEWALFCTKTYKAITFWNEEWFFSAPSVGWADWQNACFVFSIPTGNIRMLRWEIEKIREGFRQDSATWTQGTTEFI